MSQTTKWQLQDNLDREYEQGKFAPRAAGGGDERIKTDRNTLMRLYNMIDDGSLIDDSPDWKSFFSKYGGTLSMTDLKEFRSMYKKENGKDEERPDVKMSRISTLKDIMRNNKIVDMKERARFIDRYNYEIEGFEKQKGRRASEEEAVSIMQDLVSLKVLRKNTWLPNVRKQGYKFPPNSFMDVDGKWKTKTPDGRTVEILNIE